MYLAEISGAARLHGLGRTLKETLKSLVAVAQTIIQLRKENAQPLPPEIAPLRSAEGTLDSDRMTYRELRRKLKIWAVDPAPGRRVSRNVDQPR